MRLLHAGLTTVAIVASVATAAAQSDADKDAARILFTEAKELREAGKLDQALDRFKRAHELAPTPITTLELGRTHAMLGHLVEARRLYRAIEALEVKPGESAKTTAAREEGKQLAAKLDARIPTVVVKVTSLDPVDAVTLDGKAIEPGSVGAPLAIDPGKHTVVVRTKREGAPATTAEFTVAEGEKDRVVDVKVAAPEKPPGPIDPPKPPPPKGPSPWLVGSAVVGGVGLLVGVGAGFVTLLKASTLKEACPLGQCPPDHHADLDATHRWATVSNVGFVVGAVGATVFVVSLVREPKKTEVSAVSVVPYAAPLGFGLQGRF